MGVYLKEIYISNNSQFYGENSSRKEAIDKITECIQTQQQQNTAQECKIKLPYVIGPCGIGKTVTSEYTINNRLHPNSKSEYKLFLLGSHETQISLIDICEEIINQERETLQKNRHINLSWFCDLLEQEFNKKNIHETLKKKLMEEQFRDDFEQLEKKYNIIEKEYNTINEAINNYRELNNEEEIKPIKSSIIHLMAEYLKKIPEVKKYFIISFPNFDNEQIKEIRDFFLRIIDKNTSLALIKEGRFYLNDIELKKNKEFEYQLIEINSFSYKEAITFLKENIIQIKRNGMTPKQLISKIGTHPSLLSTICNYLENKPFEYLKKELFKEYDDIANRNDLEYVISLFRKNKYHQLLKFGFVYKTVFNRFVVPVYIRDWYQEKKTFEKQSIDKINMFVSYYHKDRKTVYDIVKAIEDEISQNIIIDIQDLNAGKKIPKWIRNSIKESQIAIVFRGKTIGEYQGREIELIIDKMTKDKSFKIIPVHLESSNGNIHEDLDEIKSVDFRDSDIDPIIAIIQALG